MPSTRPRAAVLGLALVASLAGAATFTACFPDYEIGSGSADAAPDGTSGSDATTADGSPDGSTSDATSDAHDGSAADAAHADTGAQPDSFAPPDAPADGAPLVDVLPPYDGPAPDAMTVVPSGTYPLDVDPKGMGMSGLIDASTTFTHSFAIDQYEVTVGRFAAWVNHAPAMPLPADGAQLDHGAYASTITWSASWNSYATDNGFQNAAGCGNEPMPWPTTYTSGAPNAQSFPVTCVNWFQAMAFCAFEGKRLPTETEWRVVAEGLTQSRYPWGASPDPPNCAYATMNVDGGCGFPVPVGSAPMGRTPQGVFDMAGSVTEFVWDRVPTGVQYTYPSMPTVDYTGLTTAVTPLSDSFLAIESGFFGPELPYSAWGAQAPWNGSIAPPAPAVMGFRCAQSL